MADIKTFSKEKPPVFNPLEHRAVNKLKQKSNANKIPSHRQPVVVGISPVTVPEPGPEHESSTSPAN